ncbi:MAG: hypothetical protein ABI895_38850 [Deltaproteobacteria bacterium]
MSAKVARRGRRAAFDGIGFEFSIQTDFFASCTEQRQECLRKRADEHESITTVSATNVRRREPHSEAGVFRISKTLLDCEPPRVRRNDL